ncbi:MAG: type II toxin-antitoxin system RelE/ParE family toxin [Phycisphaeraceae bacterium]|nr:type II toxin-antitoxin system RelE/ParE family toxin [Phycisphaeraceae bacterium]
MPETTVVFFKEADGKVPVRDWLMELRLRDRRGFAKCVERIQRLAALGHELRRPHADLLRDGIYELRARCGSVNYRILYFFHGRDAVVLAHGLTKEDRVPDAEIERALRRRRAFECTPALHVFEESIDGQDPKDD